MNIVEMSIKRPIFITCIVALMLVMGFISISKMSVDMFPDVTFPIVTVQTIYRGASPIDIERSISKPIEDELGTMSGLEDIKSLNYESISYVILKFKISTDIKDAEQQIRQRLGNVRRKLPSDIEEPAIRRIDPADQPIAKIAVRSDLDPGKLYDLVDQKIKSQFDSIQGVGLVQVIGGRKREIQVNIDMRALQERKLSLLQIADRIRATSKDVPVGKIEAGDRETVLRASGEFVDLKDLKSVNVNFVGSDRVVKLSELAEVKEGLEDLRTETSVMVKSEGFARKPSLELAVFKQSGSNTVNVVDTVLEKMKKVNLILKDSNPGTELFLERELARPVRLNIQDVRESILIGIGLCILVVFLFLGSFRSTFITGMALPNSLLGGFIIMYYSGFTINILTLLALSLAVGLLIDDAIVVRENIYRHLEMGKDPRTAAIEGTKEVALAVIATTLVVISVFGPVAFLQGIVGQFFKQFGLTVVFTMLISLFDAFTVAPMLSTYLAAPAEHDKSGTGPLRRMLNAFDRMQNWLEEKYVALMRPVLKNPMLALVGAALIFVASMMLAKYIPKNFLPAGDNGDFIVGLETPVGTSLEGSRRLAREIEKVVQAHPAIELIATTTGSSGGQAEANRAELYMRLVPRKERKQVTSEVKDDIRNRLKSFESQAKIAVSDVDITGGNQKIFNLNLTSEDLQVVSKYAERLTARLSTIPGLVDVDTNFRSGKPEFHIDFNRQKSETLGISTVTAGAELRARVEGTAAGVYRENAAEYNIRIRMSEADRDLRKNFTATLVPNVNFDMIPLSRVATGREASGFSQINRRNKARFINISANVGRTGNLGEITNEVDRLLTQDPEFKLPVGVTYGYEGQAEDMKDLFRNMLQAMGLGVLLIYLVLASLYESFIIPLTILLALPLAIVGAMIALFVTGKSFDLFSMIGIIMLLGVVAKNSILLVDYANQQMAAGLQRTEALIKACRTRLRPILMTSFALIAGTIPIAIGLNEASAQRTSMGIAIIGGLISSTVLTLVVVPAAFGYVDDFRMFLLKRARQMAGTRTVDQEIKAKP